MAKVPQCASKVPQIQWLYFITRPYSFTQYPVPSTSSFASRNTPKTLENSSCPYLASGTTRYTTVTSSRIGCCSDELLPFLNWAKLRISDDFHSSREFHDAVGRRRLNTMPIIHIVLFEFKPTTTHAQVEEVQRLIQSCLLPLCPQSTLGRSLTADLLH